MSRFLSELLSKLEAYTPGEQPQDKKYIKLNTNESPFPPSELAQEMAGVAAKRLMLYPDPDCKELTKTLAELLDVSTDEIVWTNGSDDVLNFAFMAFCDILPNKKMFFVQGVKIGAVLLKCGTDFIIRFLDH